MEGTETEKLCLFVLFFILFIFWPFGLVCFGPGIAFGQILKISNVWELRSCVVVCSVGSVLADALNF